MVVLELCEQSLSWTLILMAWCLLSVHWASSSSIFVCDSVDRTREGHCKLVLATSVPHGSRRCEGGRSVVIDRAGILSTGSTEFALRNFVQVFCHAFDAIVGDVRCISMCVLVLVLSMLFVTFYLEILVFLNRTNIFSQPPSQPASHLASQLASQPPCQPAT